MKERSQSSVLPTLISDLSHLPAARAFRCFSGHQDPPAPRGLREASSVSSCPNLCSRGRVSSHKASERILFKKLGLLIKTIDQGALFFGIYDPHKKELEKTEQLIFVAPH